MECVKLFIGFVLITLFRYSSNSNEGTVVKNVEEVIQQNLNVAKAAENQQIYKRPSVLVISLIRNKAHTLPLFLTYLQEQNYPKERISLWLATDHNEDNSREILETWLDGARDLYHSIHYQFDDSEKLRSDESNMTHWSEDRFLDLIRMKESALEHGRKSWADYVFFVDADVFLTSSSALSDLVEANLPIVAPMLVSEGLYSNFWCGMTEDYYYRRTDDYKKIRNREMIGDFVVPMVHSAVLVDLRRVASDLLTFNKTKLSRLHENKVYDGPVDDIIIFAISANFSGTKMTISNSNYYGYIMMPLDLDEPLLKDYDQLINTKVSIISQNDEIHTLPSLKKFVTYPEKSKLTFSEIYMINLKRRPERRMKMENSFRELGIEYTYFEAVDGKQLTDNFLLEKGIKLMSQYEDPYHKRPMTMGEIGCFLSHYTIWEKMVAENQKEVLIFEDDIKFESYFTDRILTLTHEARKIGGWDLIYIGRKRLQETEEFLPNSRNFVKVSYTYWTLGYVISLEGAKKLLAAKPLEKLLPVDEFLPIMFDMHANDTWKHQFEPRNLNAWSVNPLLIFPTHYTGEEGYISDTENSQIIENEPLESVDESSLTKEGKNILNHINSRHDSTEL